MEKNVKGGVIKYRLPNLADAWRIRASISGRPANFDPGAWAFSKVAEALGEYVDTTGVKLGDGELPVTENPDYSKELNEIIGEIAVRALEFYPEKKQTSKK